MKLTKIFGIVLSLHVAVILLVMFQPGCQTVPKEQVEEDPTVEQESTDASFNTGVTTPVDMSDKEVVPPTPSFSSLRQDPIRGFDRAGSGGYGHSKS